MDVILTVDEAQGLVYETPEGFSVLLREYLDSTRWYKVFRVVFTINDFPGYWEWLYEIPATENQEHMDVRNPEDRTVWPVIAEPKTVMNYTRMG